MKKIIIIISTLMLLMFTTFNFNDNTIKVLAEEETGTQIVHDYLSNKTFVKNEYNEFGSNYDDIIYTMTFLNDDQVSDFGTMKYNNNDYILSNSSPFQINYTNGFLKFPIPGTITANNLSFNCQYIKEIAFNQLTCTIYSRSNVEMSTSDAQKFINLFELYFDEKQEPQTFLKININEHIDQLASAYLIFDTNNNSYNQPIDFNTETLISNYILNGVNELKLSINYVNLPKYKLNIEAGEYSNFTIVKSINNYDLIQFTITPVDNYTQNDEIIEFNFVSASPTINLLTNTTWFLNPTLNFDYNNLHQLSLTPTSNARQGYYIAYNYNVNEVINEYMYFNDDEYPNHYSYLVNLGHKQTAYHFDFYLYDNVNYINGQLAASGFNLYDFAANSYKDQFGVVPRIMSFSHLFNTDNLEENLIFNETATDFTPLYFYDFIVNNATEFTAEQYETYNSGYNVGYNVGVDFGTESTKWISAVFGAVDDIFQVEILPNFKLWYLIGIPLLLLAVVFIFKLLR